MATSARFTRPRSVSTRATPDSPALERWTDYVETIASGLRGLVVTDREGTEMPPTEGVARWVALTQDLRERDRQLFLIGNGGSAGMASHMATDASVNGRLRAMALNDTTLLTAIGNDLAFDESFALPLQRLARDGDAVIAMSCSGNSPNIVRALEVCRTAGVRAVTVTSQRPDNRARSLGDLNFYIPLQRYGLAQCAHQIVLHYWFDQYMRMHGPGAL